MPSSRAFAFMRWQNAASEPDTSFATMTAQSLAE